MAEAHFSAEGHNQVCPAQGSGTALCLSGEEPSRAAPGLSRAEVLPWGTQGKGKSLFGIKEPRQKRLCINRKHSKEEASPNTSIFLKLQDSGKENCSSAIGLDLRAGRSLQVSVACTLF